ncbi:PHP domain-containing protein [Verrucomicrobium sp. GAS474]|uniref:MGDG synthase family glycosyltransferase n=1 Tax=Verrucomicrobium sp. GAS474 TaxID=1882831 RepID=UPI000B84B2F0|nr:PHP domain-containing protein [Verrucomicrobium sp. GAS474]
MKRILIFTAGFGEGHNTAARCVQEGIEHLAGDEAHVEIVDLFEACYGRVNEFVRKGYLTAINKTPLLWQGIYTLLDKTPLVQANLATMARMRKAMEALFDEVQPDAVVSTYPIYNFLIEEIFRTREGRPRNFAQITVVTDSISVNSLWYRCPSDAFIVPNEETAEVMRQVGVAPERLHVLGFPVRLAFTDEQRAEEGIGPLPDLAAGAAPRILYIINSGKKKAGKIIARLLERPNWEVTVTVGRDQKLQREIAAQVEEAGASGRITVLGWTNRMAELMLTHHVLVSKAGGATVQEAVAARIPMLVNQVVPGQEEGNYELLKRNHAGMLAESPKEIAAWLDRLFENEGRLCNLWRENLRPISRPDSALQAARFILEAAAPQSLPPADSGSAFRQAAQRQEAKQKSSKTPPASEKRLLLCDFHTHTTYSDGKLTVGELVDLYGQRGFDCLCVTDHLIDPARVIGKVCQWTGLVLSPAQVPEYFETLEKEKKRAWKKYGMILMAGIEFNKDGLTAKSSAHLLGIDLKAPIDPTLDLKALIAEIHAQGGLAVASHPHKFQSEWGRNTLYLWEHQDEFAPLLDAWEIANRDDLYTPVGLKRLPFLANSDFHKPKHLHSWKTLLCCEKDPEAIKQCIRENRDVALTLYRDHRFAANLLPADLRRPAVTTPEGVAVPPAAVFPFPQAA